MINLRRYLIFYANVFIDGLKNQRDVEIDFLLEIGAFGDDFLGQQLFFLNNFNIMMSDRNKDLSIIDIYNTYFRALNGQNAFVKEIDANLIRSQN